MNENISVYYLIKFSYFECYTTKDFNAWNQKKISIDKITNYNHPREKEIWWCRIGVNVGSEVYGKGSEYTRPVLIINAEGSETFIGVPLTSNVKSRKYACIIKTSDGILHTALLYQIRSFDKRRLTERMYTLGDSEYRVVKEYFSKLYKI